jgi:hypothetical protein
MPRTLYEPRNGDRVQVGTRAGEIVRCTRKPPATGYYFRVKFDDGTWDWPNHVRAESTGQYELRCRECDIAFADDNLREVFCPNCRKRQAIEAQRIAANPSVQGAVGRMGPRLSMGPRVAVPTTAPAAPVSKPKHKPGCLCGQTPDCTPF